MSKVSRKRHSAEFKAKVALEAILVVKTIRKSPRQMAESRAARARARVLSV
jgi:hypothetical protein